MNAVPCDEQIIILIYLRLALRSVQFHISLAKTAASRIYYYYYYIRDPFNNKIRGIVSCSIKACRGCQESLQKCN